eukprot:scaffold215159_cov17-Tisochrysis_lutea.AAC.1
MHLFPGVLFTFGTCAGWMQLWEAVTFGMQLARIACAAQHLAAYAGLHPHAPILPGALLCEHRGPGAHLRVSHKALWCCLNMNWRRHCVCVQTCL